MPTSKPASSVQIVNKSVRNLLIPLGFTKVGNSRYIKVQSEDMAILVEVMSYLNAMSSGLQIDVSMTSKTLLQLDHAEPAAIDWNLKGYFFSPHVSISISQMVNPMMHKFKFPRTEFDAQEIIRLATPQLQEILPKLLPIIRTSDLLEFWKDNRYLSDNFLLSMFLELKLRGLLNGTIFLNDRLAFYDYCSANIETVWRAEEFWKKIKDGNFNNANKEKITFEIKKESSIS